MTILELLEFNISFYDKNIPSHGECNSIFMDRKIGMPFFEEHCEESVRLFGSAYEQVHKWLDEYAESYGYTSRHRRKRHHMDGVMKVKELFGEIAGEVAKRHIISDLKEDGWKDSDPFPENEDEYIKMESRNTMRGLWWS